MYRSVVYASHSLSTSGRSCQRPLKIPVTFFLLSNMLVLSAARQKDFRVHFRVRSLEHVEKHQLAAGCSKRSRCKAAPCLPAGRRKRGVRRTQSYVATTSDEANAADGPFSTAC